MRRLPSGELMGHQRTKTLSSGLVIGASLALVVLAAAVIGASSRIEYAAPLAIVAAVTAGLFIVVGVRVARREQNRAIGLLIYLSGFAVLCSALAASTSQPVLMAGVAVAYLPPVMIGHLLMVFPSGRFEGAYQKRLVMLGYFDALVLSLPFVALLDFQTVCPSCDPSPLGVPPSQTATQVISIARLSLAALMTTGLAIALTQRWNNAAPSRRQQLTPVIWVGGVVLASYSLLFVSSTAGADVAVLEAATVAITALTALVPIGVSYGFARGRFSRATAVNDLVARLADQRERQVDIRDSLAELLGDESIEIVYWLPERNEFVADDGSSVSLPEKSAGRLWHPIDVSGERIGAVIYSAKIGDQSEVLRSTAAATGLALLNARLEADLRANLAELSRSRLRLLEATDAERRRIERDLHDGAQQRLISIALDLTLASNDPGIDEKSRSTLSQSATALADLTEELRDLARGIHPAIIVDKGLDGAIKSLSDRCPIPVRTSGSCGAGLTQSIEATAYFVVAEALTNIARSSRAGNVQIEIIRTTDELFLAIRDDGVGGADPSKGSGLNGLNERVATVGGSLRFESALGAGTEISASFPLATELAIERT